MNLIGKTCVACEGGTPPFTSEEIKKYLQELKTSWEVIDQKKLRQELKFKNFGEAIKFVNEVAKIAKTEGHHPDLYIYYNRVVVELSTHAVGGLSENDFIMAAKIETIK